MPTSPKPAAAPAAPAKPAYDPIKLADSLASAAEKSAKLMGEFAARQAASGKSMLAVPEGAQAMNLVPVEQAVQTEVACLTTAGQLLVFKLDELPQLPRGKGVKLVQIPGNKFKSGEETLKAVVLLSPGRSLKVFAGSRHLTIKGRDLDAYRGERGKRGGRLPRGFQRVEGLEVID